MSSGLFELRKDPITGWWVATVVDRAFHRDRFARPAEAIDDRMFGCANCSSPDGDGVLFFIPRYDAQMFHRHSFCAHLTRPAHPFENP